MSTILEESPLLNSMNQNIFRKINLNEISKGNNIDILLMEKDKKIINLSNINISLKNKIEQFQKALKEKDMELSSLKADLSSLNNDQKLKDEENNSLKNRINSLSDQITQKKKEMEIIEKKNNDNISNINKTFDLHMNEYQKLYKNYNDLTNDFNGLNSKYLNKEKECVLQQNIISDLRIENKKIIMLNKDIIEKDKVINDLKRIIKNNKEEISNHQKENKYLNEQIQNYSTNEQYIFKTRQNMYDYENIINEIKDDYNRKLKNKELIINDYKTNTVRTQADNENLISYIVEQIQQIQNKFENYSTGIDFDDDYLLNNYSKINESDDKYELIHQNFVLLTHKLNEFKRRYILELNKLKIKLEEEEISKKQLLNNIDLQKMKNNSIESNISDFKKIIEEKNKEIQELNLKINNLITQNAKNDNTSTIENDLLKEDKKIFNEFFKEFIDIITNFYIENINKKNNLFQIQTFPNYSVLDSKQKKLYDITETIKILISHINNVTNQLMSIYNTSRSNFPNMKTNNNYPSIINSYNSVNMSKLNSNNDLKKRVKEMSDLLVQSNFYLDISRQENMKMKEKYNELKKNYNTLKNENSRYNYESFDDMRNMSNQNNSKNYIKTSQNAANQSNNNNMDIYENISNSFINNIQLSKLNNKKQQKNKRVENGNNSMNNNHIFNNNFDNQNHKNYYEDEVNNQNQIPLQNNNINDANNNFNYNVNNKNRNDMMPEKDLLMDENQDNFGKNDENEMALNEFINQYTNNDENDQNNFNQSEEEQDMNNYNEAVDENNFDANEQEFNNMNDNLYNNKMDDYEDEDVENNENEFFNNENEQNEAYIMNPNQNLNY